MAGRLRERARMRRRGRCRTCRRRRNLLDAHESALHALVALLQNRIGVARRLQQMLLMQPRRRLGCMAARFVIDDEGESFRMRTRSRLVAHGQKVDLALEERLAEAVIAHVRHEGNLGAQTREARDAGGQIAGEPPVERRIQARHVLGAGKPDGSRDRASARRGRAKPLPRRPGEHGGLRQTMKRLAERRRSVGVGGEAGDGGLVATQGISCEVAVGERLVSPKRLRRVDEGAVLARKGRIAEHALPPRMPGLPALGQEGRHRGDAYPARGASRISAKGRVLGSVRTEGALAAGNANTCGGVRAPSHHGSVRARRNAGLAAGSKHLEARKPPLLESGHAVGIERDARHERRIASAEIVAGNAILEEGSLPRKSRLHILPNAIRKPGRIAVFRAAAHRDDDGLLRARDGHVEKPPRLGRLPRLLEAVDGRAECGGAFRAGNDSRQVVSCVILVKGTVVPSLLHQIRRPLAHAGKRRSPVERHIRAPGDGAALQRARAQGIVAELGDRHDGELQTLARMHGHDAHRIALAGGQRARRLARGLDVRRQTRRHASRPQPACGLQVGGVADNLVYVAGAGKALRPGGLKARKPAGIDHDTLHDLGQRHAPDLLGCTVHQRCRAGQRR